MSYAQVNYLVPEHLDPAVGPMHWIGAVSINILICVRDKVHGHTSHTLLRGELRAKAVHTKNNLQWKKMVEDIMVDTIVRYVFTGVMQGP